MTARKILSRLDRRAVLMIGASLASLASGLAAAPAQAQSTLSGIMGSRVNAPKPQPQGPGTSPQRPLTMGQALSRQRATVSRAEQIRAYVLSARDAVIAANRGTVTDGLSQHGLEPTDTIRDAIAAARAGNTARANELLIAASADLDATGLKTWQGAGLPTQTSSADGRTLVTIDQTQKRALLSWNSFNIGANTTLRFNQKENGVAQPGWVAVNRVSNAVAPSQILGNLQADGTVVVLNQQGIIFGQNAQVNTHSLLASTLELGNAARFVSGTGGPTQATTIKERNTAFLDLGLFTPPNRTASAVGENDGAALLVSGMTQGNGKQFGATLEGAIVVDRGARISSGAGGFVMLTAPEIVNAGTLSAIDGQVSLQAGRAINYEASTGAASSLDPYVRGYKLNSYNYDNQSGGSIFNSGLIESKRGYLSLGTGADGTITHAGLLSTTTSVSRNGKISITAGTVTLAGSPNQARASGIEMLADGNGETIPVGSPAAPAAFKASQLEIGTQVSLSVQLTGALVATDLAMGENAVIYAPGADIAVGANTIKASDLQNNFVTTHAGHIDIAKGAIIDVSGLKDVQLDASRNQIEITPVKRGELRDTPNYREVEVDGNFTLNGATLYIDPRIRGVRSDGVAWVGSPLIEAASIAGQIPATAAEFMTRGGTVNLATSGVVDYTKVNLANASSVHIAGGATIDFSGGWVNYAAGTVKTSKLITNDGRIVDISRADPNDVYVGVAEGFNALQPRFGVLQTFLNPATETHRYDQSYDEGRDAGALTIGAAAVSIDGGLIGNSFAGARQINLGTRPGLVSSTGGRSLQRSAYELPSGGALSITAFGDALVYHGSLGPGAANRTELLLDDQMLTGAGLSQLTLRIAGMVTFAGANPVTQQAADALTITGASNLALAPGGILSVTAGRSIRFDGDVTAASGTISAETFAYENSDLLNGSVFRQGLYGEGNGDDIPVLKNNPLYASDPGDLNPFDIVVTGTLSTAGQWINDYTEAGPKRGGAFSDGGSISLKTAANVFAAIGPSLSSATRAVDLSGSIRVSGTIDVMSGGYVTPTGQLLLDGKGGSVSLLNQTMYASTRITRSGSVLGDDTGTSEIPIGGASQSVEFTPIDAVPNRSHAVLPRLVATPSSTVDIGAASIRGFGFAGGGTFTLVAPDISFGSDNRAGSTHIGLDFFRRTGFGTLSASSYRSRLVEDLFANDRVSLSAFLETTRFVVGAGETFDLTQWMLPTLLSSDQSKALRSLGSGADLSAQSLLTPTTNDSLWDRRAASLILGGLTELDVLAGGRITGAPGANVTVSKLYNAGNITLRGGTIQQRNDLPSDLIVAGLGVRDTDLGGRGLADAFGGATDLAGRFSESALNAAGVTDPRSGRVLTNAELVSADGMDRIVYFLGKVGDGQGIVLANGSTTDLSGIGMLDPRTPMLPSGARMRAGRVLDGGAIRLAASLNAATEAPRFAAGPAAQTGRALVREDGAALDISGASLVVDQATGLGGFTSYLEWSKAGTISALGGGTLGTTPIAARGGDRRAEGGVLEWLTPTIGSGDVTRENYLSAGMIADSGFDTVIARGALTLDGDFTLNLRKALMVTSRDPLNPANLFAADASVSIGATAGTNATISASYVRFASRLGGASPGTQTGDAKVRFAAGAQGIDVAGGIAFDGSIAALTLSTPGDLRLIGVNPSTSTPSYDGQLLTRGDLTIDAGRTYATTGTGNLQALLEGSAAARPFDIAALGNHTITFGNTYLNPNAPAPLSAGSYLRVLATRIVQNGYLAAPMGLLELGGTGTVRLTNGLTTGPTESVTFGAGSITRVSGAGLYVPYGTTTDGIEYYFPTSKSPLTKLPAGELRLAGSAIVQQEGALFDGRGGGDVYAYEFQSGVGGSRDVLDRFNRDAFSSNGYDPVTGRGYQYPDQRQVFALVPADQASKIANYDPIYSADYGAAGPVDLYGANAGRSVYLDGGNGIPAGEYLLVPAKYAMSIPGALRLVENSDAVAPLPGASTRLLDGSVVIGGTYGYAGTGIGESTRHSFTIQSRDSFLNYSKIQATSGSQYLLDRAAKNGLGRSRLPLDAARVVLAPLSELRVAGLFDTTPVEGGQGGQFDILGQNILIAGEAGTAPTGTLLIQGSTLARLNAASLLIGGQRTENADGTTTIAATATSITVAGDADLRAPELLFAVGGSNSRLTIADGAHVSAIGNVGTQSSSDYLAATGGSLLRVANGSERLVTRTGAGSSTIEIGAASIAGEALVLDSSGAFLASDGAEIRAKKIAVSGQAIQFDGDAAAAGQAGVIGASLEAKLAAAEQLTVRSPGMIRFSAGTHSFQNLILDSATIAATARTAGGAAITVNAGNVTLRNATAAADGCVTAGACGVADSLQLNATTIAFGANDMRASGFANGVTLAASDGMYVEAKGSFSAGAGALTLRTPFLAERASAADPRDQRVRPDYSFLTTGDFAMRADGTNLAATPKGNLAPGARIGIGSIDSRVRSVSISGSRIRATAGIIDIQSAGDIALTGASLEVPGYEQVFGDKADPVTVSAGGGTINLLSASGNILTDARSVLVSDTGVGSAGTINLLANKGAITLDAALNPDAKGPRQASLVFDAGAGAFDLAGFVTRFGARFGGDIWVRSGRGDLGLDQGQVLKARNVTLTADGGAIEIAGTIDTSGVDVTGMSAVDARDAAVNGGDIALWGNAGVTLAATARLDTHTNGYAATDSRPASAGNVTIGIERQDASITIQNGAVIDVGARRTQAEPGVGRLIPQVISDPATGTSTTVYTYAEPDSGGVVSFRAPVIGTGHDKVALSQRGTILGADSIQLEAFQRYDLDAMADSGLYSGISRAADGTIRLDFGAAGANPFTGRFTLGDGTSSLVQFIQDFDISTVDGSGLDGMRLRPGVELASKNGIETTTQWNLAAASFSPQQLQAAVDAGVLQVIPELSQGGQTQYRVVPGREGDLLDRYATFLYRTDGGSARGEAPIVTLRAGGDLTINRSISDGFFTFRDKSDPLYTNYQLGGGARTYQPALQFTCGSLAGSCANMAAYGSGANPGAGSTLTIGLGTAAAMGDSAAAANINSPLSLIGNGAAGGGETRDSLGFAELFPLLSGDVAMHASDIRLVAGAGATLSANPLQVDRALAADVIVQGDYSYRLTAAGSVAYGGALQFHLARAADSTTNVNFDIGTALDLTDTTAGLNQLRDDAYTQLNWGSSAGLGADARAAALAYFAGKGYAFVGGAANPTGVIAPLSVVLGFLQSFEPTYQAGLASGRAGYTANRTPPVIQYGTNAQQNAADSPNQAHVRTYIRSGDGNIAASASRDIDLRGGAQAVYRRVDGTLAAAPVNSGANRAAQFAASAIYTAGTRVSASQVAARIAGTDSLVSVTPDSPYLVRQAESLAFIPSPRGHSDNQPVLARDGGDIALDAGRDVLGRRDVWTQLIGLDGQAYTKGGQPGTSTGPGATAGTNVQPWRTGSIGTDTEIGINPRYFTSGVGALAGGDVTIRAGRDISDLTIALDSTATTAATDVGKVMLAFGSGDLAVSAGRDILAGTIDVATGIGTVRAGRNIAAFGNEPIGAAGEIPVPQYLRVRLSNAVVDVSATGSAILGSVSALGIDKSPSSAGFFGEGAAFKLSAIETARIAQTNNIGTVAGDTGPREYGQQVSFILDGIPGDYIQVLPPSLEMTSLSASIVLPPNKPQLLYPSRIGQLRLLSYGDIDRLVIGMSDADPGLIGGAFAAQQQPSYLYQLPAVLPTTSDAELRRQHNQRITHAGDIEPIRIYSGGDIDRSALFLAKQARISAGRDIVDMFFSGQNLDPLDITRVWAGRDILGTTAAIGNNPSYIESNNFILGGPGTLIVEAGRDLGPFVTSVNLGGYANAGGIRTIGNDYNPWLPDQGADLQVRFGMTAGADYDALRETYLNPDNFADLDGDLFVQNIDGFGNQRPDRSRPTYAPALAKWLRDKYPALFASVFGNRQFADDGALADAAYGRVKELYTAFAGIDALHQQDFLINKLYFNEIAAAGDRGGPSFEQYVRGYRAANILFSPSLGYTDNLAAYTVDPSTISADHPLGEPVRNIVGGQPQKAARVLTGNVDLRLSTIQTTWGGDVTILGPGGDVIAGSVVRTSEQPSRRGTTFAVPNPAFPPSQFYQGGDLTHTQIATRFDSVPLGYEGVLTLRGGEIRTFTDGNFILNQSRVFSQQNGDILMWSSNGDLNAGQGPKSASNFPPVTIRLDENGEAIVNSAGSVSGAGIGTFKRTATDPSSDVILIAPVGEVDAGDAGVRASGNIVVAAARVANADNFKAAGDITGVPTAAVAPAVALPSDAASAVAAQAAAATQTARDQGNRRSLITVEVLGAATAAARCPDPAQNDEAQCR